MDGEDDTKCRKFGKSGEDVSKIDAIFLGAAVGHETAFEFFQTTVEVAFESKNHVAAHHVGCRGDVT